MPERIWAAGTHWCDCPACRARSAALIRFVRENIWLPEADDLDAEPRSYRMTVRLHAYIAPEGGPVTRVSS